MSTAPINQKEYLKKYLNIGNKDGKKKKKKKKIKPTQDRVKIIDDNIDIINSETMAPNELDEFLTQEDAPQVVGVIDDRPLELRIDDYRKSSKWKLVGSDDEEPKNKQTELSKYSSEKISHHKSRNRHFDSDESPPRRGRNPNLYFKLKKNDRDLSPPRKNRHRSPDSDTSPPRRNRKKSPDSDASPHRRNVDQSPQKQGRYDSDCSPPRKIKKEPNLDNHKRRHRSPDLSPPRRSKHSNSCPPRKIKREPLSPEGNKRGQRSPSPPRKTKKETRNPLRQKRADSDPSPPRKQNYDSDSSPPRWQRDVSPKAPRDRKRSDSDPSPPRKRNYDSDRSPPRQNSDEKFRSPAQGRPDSDKSNKKKSRWADPSPERSTTPSVETSKPGPSKKMEKTLDGKKAGLQNARELMAEIESYKQRENQLFNKMAAQSSDSNAPVIRDRKTGRKRDFEKEAMEEFEKIRKEQEQKAKYDRWGKGLKQVENLKEKVESDLHEMSKPLARYADDEDLEKYLKEQERDGDPMLAYIRKKKRQQAVDDGKPVKPMYQGEFMPNRFNIPPGHRWDGVDRSNGYEKQWFEKQNSKKAIEEDIYKWSTEDM